MAQVAWGMGLGAWRKEQGAWKEAGGMIDEAVGVGSGAWGVGPGAWPMTFSVTSVFAKAGMDAALRLRSGTGMINEAVGARCFGRGGMRQLNF